jgi:RNA polymerase sigma-70 factor (ECF subfamily)
MEWSNMDRVDNSTEQIIDELLVMDSQAGRAKAFNMLASRWQKRLWYHAYRLVGDSDAAWDITQQTWIKIIRGLRKLKSPESFKTWAYRITTNESIDWVKRSKRFKHFSIEEVQDPTDKKEKGTGVKDLLQKLDAAKRAVLCLYYFEQLSVTEISMTLHIPKGTVKSRLHSARQELKKLLEEYVEK